MKKSNAYKISIFLKFYPRYKGKPVTDYYTHFIEDQSFFPERYM